MKKMLYLACCAMVAMPIVFDSCEGMNNPNKPDEQDSIPAIDIPGTPEWYYDQITTHDSVRVDLNEQNLCGIWEEYAVMHQVLNIDGDSIRPEKPERDIIRDSTIVSREFLQFNANKSFAWCGKGDDEIWSIFSGVWQLNEETMSFRSSLPRPIYTGLTDYDWKVTVLETDRMVLTQPDTFFYDTGFYVTLWQHMYKRIPQLPEVPMSCYEFSKLHPWRVVAQRRDSVAAGQVVATKDNMLAPGTWFEFKENGMLAMYNKEKELVEMFDLHYSVTPDIVNIHMPISLTVPREGGQMFIRVTEEVYGIPERLDFYFDAKDIYSARFDVRIDTAGVPEWDWENKNQDNYLHYVYSLEAVLPE